MMCCWKSLSFFMVENLPLCFSLQFSSVQSFSCVSLFATPWTAAHQAFLSITNSQRLLKLMLIKSVMPSISSSVILFSSCFQSSPASGSFPMSQFFTSGGQSTRVSASMSVLPKNIQEWFPLGLTGLISLQSKGLSRVCLLQHQSSKASILRCSAFFMAQLSHPYMITGKTIALTIQTFISKVMSLLFNMLSRLVIAFLLRSKHLLTSWLQWFWSPRKYSHCFHCFPT